MRLAARVARSCCALQQRRGGANANAAPAATAAFAATALTFSQPLPRARSHHPSLRRLDAVLKRPLATSCRSESVQSNNRGGTAESSSSSDPSAASDDDGTAKPRPRPLPQKRQRRMRLDEAASLAAGDGVSRTVIQSWIARGKVFVDGAPVTKAGHPVSPKAVVEVRASEERFVCRGGLKLDAALGEFGIDVRGARAIDCGLSTGGFADRLLQGGAEAVLGVDVGYGQVAEKIRTDPRLFSLERTNARRLQPSMLPRGAPRSYDIATLDVSFISVLKILPAISSLLEDSAQLVILVKPQFEAGKGSVGAGGVVRDEKVRREVLATVCAAVPEAARFSVSFPYDAAGEGGEDEGDDGDEGEEEEEEEEGSAALAVAAASPAAAAASPAAAAASPAAAAASPAAAAASPTADGGTRGKKLPPPPRFVLQGTMESPIRGATSGNVEYLAYFKRG